MDMPAEVRIMIWRLSLPDARVFEPMLRKNPDGSPEMIYLAGKPPQQPNIAFVCHESRQVVTKELRLLFAHIETHPWEMIVRNEPPRPPSPPRSWWFNPQCDAFHFRNKSIPKRLLSWAIRAAGGHVHSISIEDLSLVTISETRKFAQQAASFPHLHHITVTMPAVGVRFGGANYHERQSEWIYPFGHRIVSVLPLPPTCKFLGSRNQEWDTVKAALENAIEVAYSGKQDRPALTAGIIVRAMVKSYHKISDDHIGAWPFNKDGSTRPVEAWYEEAVERERQIIEQRRNLPEKTYHCTIVDGVMDGEKCPCCRRK